MGPPLIDSYKLMHRMYRIPDARYRENLARLVELLDLGELLEVPVRQLSLGQRMRGDIAAALLHDPEVLYLDEPTIGLDVVSKTRVRDFLRQVNAERATTVLLTTHDLQDIEQVCSRVMVIDQGRLVYDGALAGLHEVGRASGRWWWTWSGSARRSRCPPRRGWYGWRGRGSGWRSRRRSRPPGWWRGSPNATRWSTCRCGSRTSRP